MVRMGDESMTVWRNLLFFGFLMVLVEGHPLPTGHPSSWGWGEVQQSTWLLTASQGEVGCRVGEDVLGEMPMRGDCEKR